MLATIIEPGAKTPRGAFPFPPIKPPDDSTAVPNVEPGAPAAPTPPPENKRLGGPPSILFVSRDGLMAAYAALCLRQQALQQNVQTLLTHDSILFGSLQPALPVDLNLIVNHARYYLSKEIRGLKIPVVATDEEIAAAKAAGNYDEKEFVSIHSASLIIATDRSTRFNMMKRFNVDPFTIRGYLIQNYVNDRNITLNRHPDDIQDITAEVTIPPISVRENDPTYQFMKVACDLQLYHYDVWPAVKIFAKQTHLINAS